MPARNPGSGSASRQKRPTSCGGAKCREGPISESHASLDYIRLRRTRGDDHGLLLMGPETRPFRIHVSEMPLRR
jgi:hypothetical protein